MPNCPNCGSDSVDNYCARCGQRYVSRRTVRTFAKDTFDDQIGVDAKLPNTLNALFFKPGFLTSEYMAGRIVRYIPPFRLYLLASLLFFVMVSFLSRRSDWAERAAREMRAPGTAQDSAGWLDSATVNVGWPWLEQKIERNMKALGRLPPELALRRVTNTIIEEMPKVMFLLLPVFALLLKLLYARRKRLYLEHFVCALHLHAFSYTLFALALVFRTEWLLIGVVAATAIYTLIAMKRVYQQGYIKTTIKWIALGWSYFLLLTFGLVFAMLWALAATPGV